MRREHNEIGSTVDPSLKFWFKGEEGRLIDEISGSSIVPNGNLLSWDATVGAYRAGYNSSYNIAAICTPVDLDTNMWNHTVVCDVWPISNGRSNSLVTLDTYPTRQAWVACTYNRLISNSWNRFAMVYAIKSSNLVERRGYVNGILDVSVDYNSDGSGFNKGTGVAINSRGGNSYLNFATYYLKNLRFYNRPLTLEEIAAL